jgi:acetyl esterase/lipase
MPRLTWFRRLCALSLVASPVLAQEAFSEDKLPPVPAEVKFCPDLTYCKIKDRALQLDLAYPTAGKGPFPVVVFIHGTGPLSQGRKYNLPQVFELAQKGYVAVTMSYRHLPEDPFPCAIHDAKCSIRWLRAHAADYKIDSERIGVIGFSGGGSLGLLLALAPANKEFEGNGGHANQLSCVQAVVTYFAPTDLPQLAARKAASWWEVPNRLYVKRSLETWLEGSLEKVPDRYRKASPITYAKKGGPPVMLIQGDEDDVVPPEQAIGFCKKMEEVGGHAKLERFKAPHDFDGKKDFILVTRMAQRKGHEFFDSHLKGKKTQNPK